MPSLVPAAQYLRMSNEHQSYSLENQAEAIQRYAELNGYEIMATFSDAGRSGVSLKGRPGLIRLLNDVMKGTCLFRAILVYDVSRWGRFQDCDEAAHYEFICKSANIPVHYCAESFLNDNGLANSIVKALKRTMAAEYSREMGARVFAAAKKLAEHGFKQGGQSAYGLRRMMISGEGHQLRLLGIGERKNVRTDRVIFVPGREEEVECVREIYRLLVQENKTPYRIAMELNCRNIAGPRGEWRQQTVTRILSDPKYTGCNVWNRSSKRLGARWSLTPRSNWIVKQGAFEAIVDQPLFQKAQRVLADQKKPYTKEELLESLRALLRSHGRLSYAILKNSRGLPSMNTFIRHFGSLRRAFELAGDKSRSTRPTSEQMIEAKRLRQQLIDRLISLFPLQVSVRGDSTSLQNLRLNDLPVSVVVCPAVRRGHGINWFIDNKCTLGTTITLLVRLMTDSSGFRDCFVMKTPRRQWIRRRCELKQSVELTHLSDFCADVGALVASVP
jgi:DNA invertase Pin-like site-specific DNA recombinase